MASLHDNDGSKKEVQLLMGVAAAFTRGKLTGAQGLAVLEATEALLRESKQQQASAGMLGALASLYTDKELPVPLMEHVLLVAFQVNSTFWRENISTYLQRSRDFMEKEKMDLNQPWRDCLGQLFTCKAEQKQTKSKALKGMTYNEEEDSEND